MLVSPAVLRSAVAEKTRRRWERLSGGGSLESGRKAPRRGTRPQVRPNDKGGRFERSTVHRTRIARRGDDGLLPESVPAAPQIPNNIRLKATNHFILFEKRVIWENIEKNGHR